MHEFHLRPRGSNGTVAVRLRVVVCAAGLVKWKEIQDSKRERCVYNEIVNSCETE